MNQITVRPALIEEVPQVLKLLVEFHGELPPIPLSMTKLLQTVVTVMLEGVILIALRDGEIVYRGTQEQIRRMTDAEFKEIYGAEAVRISAGLGEGVAPT